MLRGLNTPHEPDVLCGKNYPFSDEDQHSGAFIFVDFLHRNSGWFNKIITDPVNYEDIES